MIEVAYKNRAYCPGCEAAIWSDVTCGNISCPCGGASIRNNVLIVGNPVTDEDAFKAQAASDLQVPIDEVVVVAL